MVAAESQLDARRSRRNDDAEAIDVERERFECAIARLHVPRSEIGLVDEEERRLRCIDIDRDALPLLFVPQDTRGTDGECARRNDGGEIADFLCRRGFGVDVAGRDHSSRKESIRKRLLDIQIVFANSALEAFDDHAAAQRVHPVGRGIDHIAQAFGRTEERLVCNGAEAILEARRHRPGCD